VGSVNPIDLPIFVSTLSNPHFNTRTKSGVEVRVCVELLFIMEGKKRCDKGNDQWSPFPLRKNCKTLIGRSMLFIFK